MWPDGPPNGWPSEITIKPHPVVAEFKVNPVDVVIDVSPPLFTIVWDPELLSKDDYADLVAALGNVVRAAGGVGVQRISDASLGVPVESEVFA